MMGIAADLTGQRFGMWTALERAPSRRRSNGAAVRVYLCRCDCGVEREVVGGMLSTGQSTSCGCARAPYGSKRSRTWGPCLLARVLGYPG